VKGRKIQAMKQAMADNNLSTIAAPERTWILTNARLPSLPLTPD
jgi:hypothetical protein